MLTTLSTEIEEYKDPWFDEGDADDDVSGWGGDDTPDRTGN